MKTPTKLLALPDRYVFLILAVLSILLRLPFLKTFDLVSYDGTYYINLARSLFDGAPVGGPFPIGYPLHMAPLLPVMDDVRAAQLVSFIAGLVSLIIVYLLAKKLLSKRLAVLAALILAINPLFIRFTMNTMSEAVFICWTLLGLFFYQRERYALCGVSIGVAAITRPEALITVVILAALQWRHAKRVAVMIGCFAMVYAINVLIFSVSAGELVLLQKTKNLGLSATSWQGLEEWFGREELRPEMARENLIVHYLKRIPTEMLLLTRHLMPALLIAALYAMFRKRSFLLAPLFPFFIFPLFTPRSEPRFLLPYIPVLILFGLYGITLLRSARARTAGYTVVAAAALAGFFINWPMLTDKVSVGYEGARKLGRRFEERISRQDKVADRKPYFALYAGGRFAKIPAAPYDETIRNLTDQNVRFLSLHGPTIDVLRPALRPLLYDRVAINGELRFKQIHTEPTGEMLYERELLSDPMRRKVLTPPGRRVRLAPAWSPDGRWIAYRVINPAGDGEIRIMSQGGQGIQSITRERPTRDVLSWSPDSKRIAFANLQKNRMNIYTFGLQSGDLRQITDEAGNDRSPSWSRNGREIAFSSDRTGQDEIWIVNVATGALQQVTSDGGNTYPAISPDGDRVAWIHAVGRLVIRDRQSGATIDATPANVSFAPAWSPDGQFIAVTGEGLGASNIFLVTSDGRDALLLTKTTSGQSMPHWSPDGQQLVIVAREGENLGICVLSGLEAYQQRLLNPIAIFTLSK